jgi:hypothetical protein
MSFNMQLHLYVYVDLSQKVYRILKIGKKGNNEIIIKFETRDKYILSSLFCFHCILK